MKITFIKKQFIVNEVKRTVVCVLYYKLLEGSVELDSPICRTVGKAKANSIDTFNPFVGKKIALARAESQAYADAALVVQKHMKYILNYEDELRIFLHKAYGVQQHNKQYINSL